MHAPPLPTILCYTSMCALRLDRRLLPIRVLDALTLLARDLDGRGEEADELVELREARLEVLALCDLKLNADAEAVHAVRIVHRTHRQQVLEELAALAVVGQLHVAIDAAVSSRRAPASAAAATHSASKAMMLTTTPARFFESKSRML